MSINDVIQTKLNQLISILLTDGVQPGEIADNIFLKEYDRISSYKLSGSIINEITFKETIDNELVETTLRYYYNSEKKLMRIDEESNGKVQVEWDRESAESILINDIVDILKVYYTEIQMQKFISSLPDKLKNVIETEYFKVA